MNTEVLSIITWEDLEEFFKETNMVMIERSIMQDFYPPFFETREQTFSEVLRRLREKYQCITPLQERYAKVLRAAETAVGKKLSKERGTGNTTIRCFVSYQLHQEGYSYHAIGRAMRRDHSTITHHCRVMEDMLSVPEAYKGEMAAYYIFLELLAEKTLTPAAVAP